MQKALDGNYEDAEEDISMNSDDIGFGLGPRGGPNDKESDVNDESYKSSRLQDKKRNSSLSKSRDLNAVMQKIRRQTKLVASSQDQSSVIPSERGTSYHKKRLGGQDQLPVQKIMESGMLFHVDEGIEDPS